MDSTLGVQFVRRFEEKQVGPERSDLWVLIVSGTRRLFLYTSKDGVLHNMCALTNRPGKFTTESQLARFGTTVQEVQDYLTSLRNPEV